MNYIVCVDKNWGIGKGGDLLFSLPSDMKFFRETTSGKTVVMGRKTLLSLPGGRPLKNRRNIVLTRNKDFRCDGAEVVFSVEQLFKIIDKNNGDIFVMGGAEIYNSLYNFCKTAYITKVADDGGADVFIKNLDREPNWKLSKESEPITENGHEFVFCTYENLEPEEI